MPYTPTEWKKGDVVTSEKLNKMESGIKSRIYTIDLVENDNGAISVKTGQQILEDLVAKDYDFICLTNFGNDAEMSNSVGGGYFVTSNFEAEYDPEDSVNNYIRIEGTQIQIDSEAGKITAYGYSCNAADTDINNENGIEFVWQEVELSANAGS